MALRSREHLPSCIRWSRSLLRGSGGQEWLFLRSANSAHGGLNANQRRSLVGLTHSTRCRAEARRYEVHVKREIGAACARGERGAILQIVAEVLYGAQHVQDPPRWTVPAASAWRGERE